MKRWICMLLALMLLALAACGAKTEAPAEATEAREADGGAQGSAAEPPAGEAAQPIPSGLYMIEYLGNEAGEYVPEANEYLDFFNQPTTLLDMMWADNCTIWCEIGEDGVGTYTDGTYDPVTMDFNTGEPGMLRFGGVRTYDGMADEYLAGEALVPYHYDEATGVFWFEEQPGFWAVMAPCSQEKLDLVFHGMGGSVPVSEAEIGDLVCLGRFVQDENQEELSPVYWRVLDKQNGKVLLLCDRLLDSFSYNYNPNEEVLTDLTWESCSLRAFLNDGEEGFLTMFSEDERALMQPTHLENKAANEELMAQWGSFEDQGEKLYSELAVQDRADDPDTEDTVFLLSYQEVLRYLGEPTEEYAGAGGYPFTEMKVNPDWIAAVTDAVRVGYYETDTGGGAWMTRTLCHSHSDEDMVVYITGEGQVFDYFTYVPLFIRPAVWVSTEGS